jgi:hypothetical protein
LTAPLVRRPGIYLADVSAGPAGYQRLVIDDRSGQILERFGTPGRIWGPVLAARGGQFDEPPPPGIARPPLSAGFLDAAVPVPAVKSAHGEPPNVHVPSAVSPYGTGETPAVTKPKPKSISTERKPAETKPGAAILNAPLPPPAPRETMKPEGSGSPAPKPAENHDSDQPKIDPRSTEVDNYPAAAPSLSAEANDKPKVSIVPAAPFE